MLRLKTLMIALAGAMAFLVLGLPLPFLFGPMAACLIAALAGLPLQGPGQVAVASRTILGVAVGAAITPELLRAIPGMAATVAIIPIYLAVIAAIGVPFFTRLCKFDLPTAYYASMPGGLQDMIVFGEEAGANVRSLSLIHATRVMIIATVVPLLLVKFMGVSLSNPIGAPAADLPLSEMLIMAAAALVGWKLGERVGLFGASILGPLIATAVLSLTGLLHHRPPAEAILTAQFFIGMGIGINYSGITLKELRHDVASAVAFVLILAALAAAVTQFIVSFDLAPPLEAFLAFAPGGQAEMTVLAIITGADLGFVVLHHILRIVLVITGAPVLARMVLGPSKPGK